MQEGGGAEYGLAEGQRLTAKLLLVGALALQAGSTTAPVKNLQSTYEPQVVHDFLASQWDKGWFRAHGMWRENGVRAFGEGTQAVELTCDLHLKICIEAAAELGPAISGRPFLYPRAQLYDIEVWNSDQIRTVRSKESCGYFVITVDRNPPKVYANKVNDGTRNKFCTTPGLVETMELDAVGPVPKN